MKRLALAVLIALSASPVAAQSVPKQTQPSTMPPAEAEAESEAKTRGAALERQTIAPTDEGQVMFTMPSNNIDCIYTPAGGTSFYTPEDGGPELSCDRAEPSYKRFILSAAGPAKRYDTVGDTACCGMGATFQYGRRWRLEPFTCWSERTGLTCERDDGHGFFISRARVEVY